MTSPKAQEVGALKAAQESSDTRMGIVDEKDVTLNEEDDSSVGEIPNTTRRQSETITETKDARLNWLFALFFITQIFVNYDAGAVPILLVQPQFKEDFPDISMTQLGIVGALPFIGVATSSATWGNLLEGNFSQQRIMALGMLSNTLACLLMVSSKWLGFEVLCLSRFLIGITQAAFVIFAPVWVDTFAPCTSAAIWLGLIQASVALGIMVGYGITGLLVLILGFDWTSTFWLQIAVLGVLLLIFLFIPSELINIPNDLLVLFGDEADNIRKTKTSVKGCVDEVFNKFRTSDRKCSSLLSQPPGDLPATEDQRETATLRSTEEGTLLPPPASRTNTSTSPSPIQRPTANPWVQQYNDIPITLSSPSSQAQAQAQGQGQAILLHHAPSSISQPGIQQPVGIHARTPQSPRDSHAVQAPQSLSPRHAPQVHTTSASSSTHDPSHPTSHTGTMHNMIRRTASGIIPAIAGIPGHLLTGPKQSTAHPRLLEKTTQAFLRISADDNKERSLHAQSPDPPKRSLSDPIQLRLRTREEESGIANKALLEGETHSGLESDHNSSSRDTSHDNFRGKRGTSDPEIQFEDNARGSTDGGDGSESHPDGSGLRKRRTTLQSMIPKLSYVSLPVPVIKRENALLHISRTMSAFGQLNSAAPLMDFTPYHSRFQNQLETLSTKEARKLQKGDLGPTENTIPMSPDHKERQAPVRLSSEPEIVPIGGAYISDRLYRRIPHLHPLDEEEKHKLADIPETVEELPPGVGGESENEDSSQRRDTGQFSTSDPTDAAKNQADQAPSIDVHHGVSEGGNARPTFDASPSQLASRGGSAKWPGLPEIPPLRRREGKVIEKLNIMQKLLRLARNGTLVALIVTLCSLFFVVTGIQLWATKFFIDYFGKTDKEVLGAFLIVSATGPVIGVVVGGFVIDCKVIGGYKTLEGKKNTMLLMSFFGILATMFGLFAGLSEKENFYSCVVFIWLLLLFGGAILPAATGVLLQAVNPEERAFASAIALMMYNLFGYTLGCFLPGVIMDAFKRGDGGGNEFVRKGMLVIFCWSIFGVLGSLYTTWDIYSELKRKRINLQRLLQSDERKSVLDSRKLLKTSFKTPQLEGVDEEEYDDQRGSVKAAAGGEHADHLGRDKDLLYGSRRTSEELEEEARM